LLWLEKYLKRKMTYSQTKEEELTGKNTKEFANFPLF